MKRKLTPEQRYRRRAEYSIRVAALCFALLFALCVASGVLQSKEASAPAKEESVEQAPAERPEMAETEAAPAAEEDPLANWGRVENATMTHYCVCEKCCGKTPDHPAYGITASGREAEPYVSVAVDPLLIPLGASLLIDYGDGELVAARADDTGSGVTGGHIDLCMASHEEALEAGVKMVNVYWTNEEANIFEHKGE